MKVFVLLPTHLDAVLWRRRYELGEVPDIVPYGYHHAADAGCEVRFSRPTLIDKGPFGLLRRVLNRLLGCDLIHAFNNRAEFVRSQCDVVWTHTEYEHLAVRLIELLSLGRIKAAPMISQSVWLMDRWSTYSALRRLAYRRLLRKSEVLTFLSPSNAEAARKRQFGLPVEIVPFGISQDSFPVGCPRDTPNNMPLRVFSLGNDVHRDWETFAAAFGDQSDFEVRVASRTYPKHLERANIVARSLNHQSEIIKNYAWADIVVVPLTKNLHASGLSVLLETVTLGIPVVISDEGGLRHYFGDDQVNFVPGNDPEKLRTTVRSLERSVAIAKATAAQKRLLELDYSSRGYALRHVTLSRVLTQNHGHHQVASDGK